MFYVLMQESGNNKIKVLADIPSLNIWPSYSAGFGEAITGTISL